MGSCSAFSQRHISTRGIHSERLCCGAAPARSPASTFQEASARNSQSKEFLRHSPQESFQIHSISRSHLKHEVSVPAPAILECSPLELVTVRDPAADSNSCSARSSHVASTAAELGLATPAVSALTSLQTPSCLNAEAHFLLSPPDNPRPEQQVRLFQNPDVATNRLLEEENRHQQQQQRLHLHHGELSYQDTVDAHESQASQPPSLATTQEPLSPVGHQQWDNHASQQPLQSQSEAVHDACHTAHLAPSAMASAVDYQLPLYLDAASRSEGVASTSDPHFTPTGVGPQGLGVAARVEGGPAWRRASRNGSYDAPEPTSKTSLGTTLAAETLGDGDDSAPAGSTRGSGRRRNKAIRGNGSSSGATVATSGASAATAVPASTSPAPSKTRPQPRSRQPRAPCPAEHRALRLRARLHQAALLPRAPTEEDLRLTARITCAPHWRDLIALLAEHREQFNQREHLQEHLQPFLQRSAKLQQPRRLRRRGSSGGGSAAATAATTTAVAMDAGAAAAAAAAGLVDTTAETGALMTPLPVSALPLTAHHVAAALQRTWQLLMVVSGPQTPAEARALAAMVDWLARLAARLAPSPGTTLREISTIFCALVRLRHPLSKRYYLALMTEARERFTTAPQRGTRRRRRRHPGSTRGGGSGALKTTTAAETTSSPSLPYNAQDMSQLLWAVANSGMQGLRSDWAMSYFSALLSVVSEMTPQGVGVVLHSLARLRCTPPPGVLAALCRRLVQLTGYGSDVGLRQIPHASSAVAAVAPEDATGSTPSSLGSRPLDPGPVTALDVSLTDSLDRRQQREQPPRQQHQQRPRGPVGCTTEHRRSVMRAEKPKAGGDDGRGRAEAAGTREQQRQQQQLGLDGGSLTAAGASSSSSTTAAPRAPRMPAAGGIPGGMTGGGEEGVAFVRVPLPPHPSLSPPSACLPADVSMSMWALATLRLQPEGYCPQLLPAVERYSLPRLTEFPEQELSNLVWALARLQYSPGHDWVRNLYDAIRRLLPELRPQALSTLLYGLAQMGQRPDVEWMDAVLPYVQLRLQWFPPQSLALTIHALAVMGCRPPAGWLVAFHSRLDAYRGQLDMRVRSKVREAYRLMDFRPGSVAAAAGGVTTVASEAATEVIAAEIAALDGANAHGKLQLQRQQQLPAGGLRMARQGPRAIHASSSSRVESGNGVIPVTEVSLRSRSVPGVKPQSAEQLLQDGMEEEEQQQQQLEEEEGEEERENALSLGPQLQLPRGEAAAGGDPRRKASNRESSGVAVDDSLVGQQVLLKPSRFMF